MRGETMIKKQFPLPARTASTALMASVALTLGALLAAGPAAAGNAVSSQGLQQQIDTLQSELARIKAQQAKIVKAQKIAAKNKPAGTLVRVKHGTGLSITTEDKQFSAHLGGRMMVDTAFYSEDKSRMGNGTEMRRARLFLKGTLLKDWAYKNQFDFAGNKIAVKDAYLKYEGFKPATFTVGNFKEPFSLEDQTSSKYITFMERGLPNVFAPGRHLGIGAATHGNNWTVAGGVYGDTLAADPSGEEDEGWDVAARGTVAFGCPTACLHLGLSGRYHEPDGLGTTRFRERPESHQTNVRFVDTGTINDVDGIVNIVPEAAFIYGPFALQGEYMRAWVNRSPTADVAFSGWYAEASYFLTGESRAYNPKKGSFGRVKPKNPVGKGGLGAWQVAVRYSSLDLTDGAILGGEEKDVTLGLNWYLNPYVRLMLNAIWVNTDANATGNAANLLGNQTFAGNDDPFIFQARAQVDF